MNKENTKPETKLSVSKLCKIQNIPPKQIIVEENNNQDSEEESKISSISTQQKNDLVSDEINDDESDDSSDNSVSDAPDLSEIVFVIKEKYYFKSVDKFFKNEGKPFVNIMVDIVEKRSHVSLRLIDWFVTKYAFAKKISYFTPNSINDEFRFKFPVHISYKAQLKAYKKKYFDPFRRKQKFMYPYYDNNVKKKLMTTIGQLNFFMWAFENNVVNYVFDNFDVLSKAMNKSNKQEKKKKKNAKNNPSPTNDNDKKIKNKSGLEVNNISNILSFD